MTAPLVAWSAQDFVSTELPLRQVLEQSLCPVPVELAARQRLRAFYVHLDHRPQWRAGRLADLTWPLEPLADYGPNPAKSPPARPPTASRDPPRRSAVQLT